MVVMFVLSLISVILSIIGIFGMTAYQVARQRKEIGLRMAMGASSGKAAMGILFNGMIISAIGILLGISVYWVFSPFLSSILVEVAFMEFITILFVSIFLAGTEMFAICFAVRCTCRFNPMELLRA